MDKVYWVSKPFLSEMHYAYNWLTRLHRAAEQEMFRDVKEHARRHWLKGESIDQAEFPAAFSMHVRFVDPNKSADADSLIWVAKAFLDGLVATKIITDDNPRWIKSITCHAPQYIDAKDREQLGPVQAIYMGVLHS